MPVDLLVVGLGNPGDDYARTRHNAGAEVVELLARRHGGKLHGTKGRARSDEVRMGSKRVALAIPLTYMNDSGEAVAGLMRRLGVEPDQIVIVHDELDLPPAVLRVKVGGGLAGHNGLRSIKQHLHTDEFLRVRVVGQRAEITVVRIERGAIIHAGVGSQRLVAGIAAGEGRRRNGICQSRNRAR